MLQINTNPKYDENRIGSTGIKNALQRKRYTSMPYSEEIYKELTQEERDMWHEGMASHLFKHFPGFFPNFLKRIMFKEGRYLLINDAIRRLEGHSVLELAAGFSSRSLEIADSNLLYVETDLQPIIKIKKRVVQAVRSRRGMENLENHYFSPLNVTNPLDFFSVGNMYFSQKDKRPIKIITEGLFAYLDENEKIQVRDNIANFLANYSSNGVWITSDFVSYYNETCLDWISKKNMEYRIKKKLRHLKEPEGVEKFLRAGNLKGESGSIENLIDRLTCVPKLGISINHAREIAKNFRIHLITLR